MSQGHIMTTRALRLASSSILLSKLNIHLPWAEEINPFIDQDKIHCHSFAGSSFLNVRIYWFAVIYNDRWRLFWFWIASWKKNKKTNWTSEWALWEIVIRIFDHFWTFWQTNNQQTKSCRCTLSIWRRTEVLETYFHYRCDINNHNDRLS